MGIWSHWCWAVHLQGRGEGRKEQPPALLPCAALPCTALLTGLLLCQPFPWLCGAACVPRAVLGARRPDGELRTGVCPALVPSWCGCPSARQREGREEGSSLLPCCPVLPSPAQPCSPGCCSENGFLGRLGHQCHVDPSTAVSRSSASTCSGARTQQSSTKC